MSETRPKKRKAAATEAPTRVDNALVALTQRMFARTMSVAEQHVTYKHMCSALGAPLTRRGVIESRVTPDKDAVRAFLDRVTATAFGVVAVRHRRGYAWPLEQVRTFKEAEFASESESEAQL